MKKFTYILAVVLCSFFLCACSEDSTLDMAGMFSPNGETVATRFEQSMAFNTSVGDIHLNMAQDDYSIYVCTDSHITRNTHRNLDHFVATYLAASGPKLAIHLGDVIDAQKNYPCADSILHLASAKINEPDASLFVTPGNHDIYFKQWSYFKQAFNSSVFWFDTNNGSKKLDLFICLDSAEGEIGSDQMAWLRDLLSTKSKEGYRHIVIFTHTHLWKLDGSQGHTSNYALEATYELTSLLSQYGVEYVWSGHQHARQFVTFKGVHYLVLNSTKDEEKGQSYMIASMSDAIQYTYIDYPKINL